MLLLYTMGRKGSGWPPSSQWCPFSKNCPRVFIFIYLLIRYGNRELPLLVNALSALSSWSPELGLLHSLYHSVTDDGDSPASAALCSPGMLKVARSRWFQKGSAFPAAVTSGTVEDDGTAKEGCLGPWVTEWSGPPPRFPEDWIGLWVARTPRLHQTIRISRLAVSKASIACCK